MDLPLYRLCNYDDPEVAEKLSAFQTRYGLIELPEPDDEPVPPGHDYRTGKLTLGQLRVWLRETYKATFRLYLKPSDTGTVTAGGTGKKGDNRTILIIRHGGHFWYADATEFVRALPKKAPEEADNAR